MKLLRLFFQNAILYVSISVLYLMCSSLVIHQVYVYEESFALVPKGTITQLFITGVSKLVIL